MISIYKRNVSKFYKFLLFEVVNLKSLGLEDKGYEHTVLILSPNVLATTIPWTNKGFMAILKYGLRNCIDFKQLFCINVVKVCISTDVRRFLAYVYPGKCFHRRGYTSNLISLYFIVTHIESIRNT